MNAKQLLYGVGVLVVLGAIAGGLSFFAHKEAPAAPQKSPILGGVATSTGSYEYTKDAPYYTVDAVYPRVVPLSGAAGTKAQATIEQSIADDIAQFIADSNLDNLTPNDIAVQGLGPDKKYAIGFSYDMYQSTNTVSYVFLEYQDTLGAHPNSFYKTFTFDQAGNQLTLADLFTPGASYLPRLSPLAYAGVVAQLQTREGAAPGADELDTARIGTEPSPEALQFFYIDGTTLHLLFPPYQVAAYAAGTFDVAIELSSLKDILK